MEVRQYPGPAGHVYFFATCLVDLFVPEAGMDAIRLLEREGIVVHYPPQQSCCGQPAYSSGNPEQARKVALAQFDLFPNDWPVIVPSGSCAGMMRHHWPALFEQDTVNHQKALALSARIFELSEYLLNVLQLDQQLAAVAEADSAAVPERFVLHTSCGARREMGTRRHGVALLDSLPGVQRVEHERESECCGFGGTFSLKHPDISGAMVKDKLASICATGCKNVVSADCGCLLNIGHAAEYQKAGLKFEHISTFLLRHGRTGTTKGGQ